MGDADVEQVLAWRNHPLVKSKMLTQHDISLSDHRRWFERMSADDSKRLLVIEEDEQPLGFVHFSGVSAGGVADWGFYAVPMAPKGTGRKLGGTAIAHAFDRLALHKICAQVLEFNEASIRLHLALGFVQEGRLRQHARIDGNYYDLLCFGLLRQEWKLKENK